MITYDQVTSMETDTWIAVNQPWGGVTINMTTLGTVPDGVDAYAVSILPYGMSAVSIPEDASYAEFQHAFNVALITYGGPSTVPYLGVWHDDEHHVIEFDPVEVVGTLAEVDALGAIYPVAGGAYHFKDHVGYYPNGKVKENV